ncbi:MAG: hypothetical protein ACTSRW_10455 [Candidatus Helarchaeota archaeon]
MNSESKMEVVKITDKKKESKDEVEVDIEEETEKKNDKKEDKIKPKDESGLTTEGRPKIIEVKKMLWSPDQKCDFQLENLQDMIDLAKLLKIEAIYHHKKRYFFKDNRWVWYYSKE